MNMILTIFRSCCKKKYDMVRVKMLFFILAIHLLYSVITRTHTFSLSLKRAYYIPYIVLDAVIYSSEQN